MKRERTNERKRGKRRRKNYVREYVIECSVMCQLPIELNYRKSRANYRHIIYVWSTDKFTERGRAN